MPGARLAEPGEFTLRAYLHGRMDLVQAEAVQDLVAAVTPLQARTAFDQLEGTLTERIKAIDARCSICRRGSRRHWIFPARVITSSSPIGWRRRSSGIIASIDTLLGDARAGRLVREGAQVVIVGRPNAGKSTLFNALAGERARDRHRDSRNDARPADRDESTSAASR